MGQFLDEECNVEAYSGYVREKGWAVQVVLRAKFDFKLKFLNQN